MMFENSLDDFVESKSLKVVVTGDMKCVNQRITIPLQSNITVVVTWEAVISKLRVRKLK